MRSSTSGDYIMVILFGVAAIFFWLLGLFQITNKYQRELAFSCAMFLVGIVFAVFSVFAYLSMGPFTMVAIK